ncbi:lactosylceramide 1,3-N-acetyl-beta-D-glucosaminyltransferase isoform X2 [Taeniopygia guttata]|uniref:lactosylceramide 1,3-N-acetyl-beta-D-glucosaminyltransferase isoform X2 n=1 Tax=Taeniopygia guttata TaxID=59729 RepID=UPI003BB85A0D
MASPKKCLISKYFRTFSTSLSALCASAHDGFPTSHAAVSPCPVLGSSPAGGQGVREQRDTRAGEGARPGAGSAALGAEPPVAPGPPEPVCSRGAPWPGPSRPCRPREPAEEEAALRPVRTGRCSSS